MSERYKALMRRAVDRIWNGGDFSLLSQYVASDIVFHASRPGNEIHGHEGLRRALSALREGFQDIHFTIEDQIAEGDRIVTRWIARATHTGMFLGIPPTGRSVTIAGIDIDRVAGGKVVECWENLDELGLLQQLGVVPASEPAETAVAASSSSL